MRPQMPVQLLNAVKGTLMKGCSSGMDGTQREACTTLSMAFCCRVLVSREFNPHCDGWERQSPREGRSLLTSSVLCFQMMVVTCITGEPAG